MSTIFDIVGSIIAAILAIAREGISDLARLGVSMDEVFRYADVE